MKILFVASECVPFVKTGGLADVIGALPKFISPLGHSMDVFIPRYSKVSMDGLSLVVPSLSVTMGNRLKFCSVWRLGKTAAPGVNYYFVNSPEYFDRPELYGDKSGDYGDNAERFALLSRAAIEFAKRGATAPNIIHCHDWQSALVPVLLKSEYNGDWFFGKTATVFTIHNMGYQGLFGTQTMQTVGLQTNFYHPGSLEYFGKVNYLKGGIVYADAVTTVSKKYSQEIQTPEYGFGLHGVVQGRAADIYGILNGVDYAEWNPASDSFIARAYALEHLEGKKECKRDLLREFRLPEQLDRPLMGIISRLVDQKGFDLIAEGIEPLLAMNPFFVVLGSGDQKYEYLLHRIASVHHKQVGLKLGYDHKLAHKIEAGADIFLMPSKYEPCGLNQIYSLKYGTVPVVRATGGLDDTVESFDPSTGRGTGFKFHEYASSALVRAVRDALETYRKPALWQKLIQNAMAQDFSWTASARQYIQLYEQLLLRRER